MTLFADWTRGELLQLGGLVTASLATIVGLVVTKKVTEIHVLFNSRFSQIIAGARAEGGMKERAEADARIERAEQPPTEKRDA
jgi:hypothetical protein